MTAAHHLEELRAQARYRRERLELYRSTWAFPVGHHTMAEDATRSRIVGQSRGADGASYGLAPEVAGGP